MDVEQSSNDMDDSVCSDECQWTIVNEKYAIMKIDSGTANDGRTALSDEMLRFFDIDVYSSGQLRGISVIHSDIKYDCIIRRLARKSNDGTPLYIIKWNKSLSEVIKIYFLSGVKTHIVFSKSESKSTYRLELIKNPDDYINNLQTAKPEIKAASIPENETVTLTEEKESPLLKRRERVIKNLSSSIYHYIFSRTHTANRHIVEFLLNHTENGRKFLKEVFECQLESELQYTYGDITKVPVINVQTGQEGNRENYSQNAISIATQQIIEDSVAFFGGINLLLQVQYPSTLFIQMYNYTQGE